VESDIVVVVRRRRFVGEVAAGLEVPSRGGLGGVEVPGRRHGGEHLLEEVVVVGGDWFEVVNLGALDLLRRLLLLLLMVVIDDCGGLGGRFEVGSGGSSFLAFLCYTVAYLPH
jgi:hypothetical protein